MDTDVSEEKGFDVPKLDKNGLKLTELALIEAIKKRFEQLFAATKDAAFFDNYQHRILFAITINALECWLLPLYYADNTKAATTNCLFKLNQQLAKNNEKPISKDKKGAVPTYKKIAKPYLRNKILMNKYSQNPSFKIFVENELQVKISVQKDENTEGSKKRLKEFYENSV